MDPDILSASLQESNKSRSSVTFKSLRNVSKVMSAVKNEKQLVCDICATKPA